MGASRILSLDNRDVLPIGNTPPTLVTPRMFETKVILLRVIPLLNGWIWMFQRKKSLLKKKKKIGTTFRWRPRRSGTECHQHVLLRKKWHIFCSLCFLNSWLLFGLKPLWVSFPVSILGLEVWYQRRYMTRSVTAMPLQ